MVLWCCPTHLLWPARSTMLLYLHTLLIDATLNNKQHKWNREKPHGNIHLLRDWSQNLQLTETSSPYWDTSDWVFFPKTQDWILLYTRRCLVHKCFSFRRLCSVADPDLELTGWERGGLSCLFCRLFLRLWFLLLLPKIRGPQGRGGRPAAPEDPPLYICPRTGTWTPAQNLSCWIAFTSWLYTPSTQEPFSIRLNNRDAVYGVCPNFGVRRIVLGKLSRFVFSNHTKCLLVAGSSLSRSTILLTTTQAVFCRRNSLVACSPQMFEITKTFHTFSANIPTIRNVLWMKG